MRHQGFTKIDKSCGNVFFMKSNKKVIEILKIWQNILLTFLPNFQNGNNSFNAFHKKHFHKI